MKKIILMFLLISYSSYSQSEKEEMTKLNNYLESHGVVKEIDGYRVTELDGVVCRVLIRGFSGQPECGILKGLKPKDTEGIRAVLTRALGKKTGAGIQCHPVMDEKIEKPIGDLCGPALNISKDEIHKKEDRCRFLQGGLVRVHRPETRSCSKDASICIGTVQCKGQGPSTAACAPKNGLCSQSADECVEDNGVKLYKKYGTGLLDEEEPMGSSRQ